MLWCLKQFQMHIKWIMAYCDIILFEFIKQIGALIILEISI
jgi:hypothetical protein